MHHFTEAEPPQKTARSQDSTHQRSHDAEFLSPEYLKPRTLLEEDTTQAPGRLAATTAGATSPEKQLSARGDAPSCSICGMLMVPNGSCYKCANCGSTSGCS